MANTFFVVEDHALTNLGIRQFFQEHGFTCTGAAATLPEAEEKLLSPGSTAPDILILDLFLGEESGMKLLRSLSASSLSVKTVVYSMYTNPGIVNMALEAGAQGFVAKSSPTAELLRAVRSVIAGSTYVQQDLAAPLVSYGNLLTSFTKQERAVFKLLIERKTNDQIAAALSITLRSVENYLSRIYSKTGVSGHEAIMAKFG